MILCRGDHNRSVQAVDDLVDARKAWRLELGADALARCRAWFHNAEQFDILPGGSQASVDASQVTCTNYGNS